MSIAASPVTIEIAGVDRLIAKLGRIEGTGYLRAPMQRAVKRILRDMQEYPPQRPGSLYVRGRGMADADGIVRRLTSETLGKRWTSKVAQEGEYLTGRVGNNASYAPFVQSRQFQAAIHRGRWNTDVQIVNRHAATIKGDFEAAIREALK